MDTKATFKNRFLELCGEKTQQSIAEAIGVSRATVGYYMSGDRSPDIEILSRIAKYFDVTSDYLLGLTDNKNFENVDIGKRLGLSDELITQIENVNKKTRKDKEITEISMLNCFLLSCCDKRIFGHLREYANTLSVAAEKPQLSLEEILISAESSEVNKEINSLNSKADKLGLELLDQREAVEYREFLISNIVYSVITEMFAEEKNKVWGAYFNLIKEGDNNADD